MDIEVLRHIDIEKLETGRFLARPKGQLGNCGFHPYPWVASVHRSDVEAIEDFYLAHKGKIDNYLEIEDE